MALHYFEPTVSAGLICHLSVAKTKGVVHRFQTLFLLCVTLTLFDIICLVFTEADHVDIIQAHGFHPLLTVRLPLLFLCFMSLCFFSSLQVFITLSLSFSLSFSTMHKYNKLPPRGVLGTSYLGVSRQRGLELVPEERTRLILR